MSITVVGDVMVDVVARHAAPLAHGSDTPATVRITGGGSGGNVAAWLEHAGAAPTLVACAGDDAAAAIAAPGARRHPSLPTGTCVVLVGPDGERTMLPDPGANLDLRPPDGPAGVVYVSGYQLMRPPTRAAARAWLAAAARSVLDPASAALIAADPGAFEGLAVDLLILNEAEAAVLGDAVRARETVLKRGAAGATWTDGARELSVPAAPVAGPVLDTTGAGDAFAAGFLAAWDEGPEAALARGAALAAEAVGVQGGRPAPGVVTAGLHATRKRPHPDS